MLERNSFVPQTTLKHLKAEERPVLPDTLPGKGDIFVKEPRMTGIVHMADLLADLNVQYPQHKVTI